MTRLKNSRSAALLSSATWSHPDRNTFSTTSWRVNLGPAPYMALEEIVPVTAKKIRRDDTDLVSAANKEQTTLTERDRYSESFVQRGSLSPCGLKLLHNEKKKSKGVWGNYQREAKHGRTFHEGVFRCSLWYPMKRFHSSDAAGARCFQFEPVYE